MTIEKGIDAWLDEYRPDAVAVERVFARSDVSTVMGTAQASGIAMVVRGPARAAGRAAHAQRGQGRGLRQRPGRQGPGRGDGHPASCGSTRRPSPADAADALALAITHIWRGGAQARIDAAAAPTAAAQQEHADDRLRPRHGRRRHARPAPCSRSAESASS